MAELDLLSLVDAFGPTGALIIAGVAWYFRSIRIKSNGGSNEDQRLQVLKDIHGELQSMNGSLESQSKRIEDIWGKVDG